MELIEREALIKAIENDCPEQATYTKKDAIECVLCMPTIDAIRVAGGCRCGECRYWDDDGRCEPPENGLIREYTKPTDFCSYGKPREAQKDG